MEPNRKCCTTGSLSKTSASYIRSRPLLIFSQDDKWLISFSIGEDSKKGTLRLIFLMNCMQPRYIYLSAYSSSMYVSWMDLGKIVVAGKVVSVVSDSSVLVLDDNDSFGVVDVSWQAPK